MEQSWTLSDIPDLQGKVAVVTGARYVAALYTSSRYKLTRISICSSGIGLAIVAQLATHGAKAYFTARSLEKAEKAKQTLLESHPEVNPNNIDFLLLDFTDLRSITDAAHALQRNEAKIDILGMLTIFRPISSPAGSLILIFSSQSIMPPLRPPLPNLLAGGGRCTWQRSELYLSSLRYTDI